MRLCRSKELARATLAKRPRPLSLETKVLRVQEDLHRKEQKHGRPGSEKECGIRDLTLRASTTASMRCRDFSSELQMAVARSAGHRPGAEVRWQSIAFQGDYGSFYAAQFLKETQPGRNLNYWALWAGYKF